MINDLPTEIKRLIMMRHLLKASADDNPDRDRYEKPFAMSPESMTHMFENLHVLTEADPLMLLSFVQGRVLASPEITPSDKTAILTKLFEVEWDYAVVTSRLMGTGKFADRDEYVEIMLEKARVKGHDVGGEGF